MESSGGGVTFSEKDLANCKRIMALINMSKYSLDVAQIMQAAEALSWFQSSLIPAVEANILEFKRAFEAQKPEAK